MNSKDKKAEITEFETPVVITETGQELETPVIETEIKQELEEREDVEIHVLKKPITFDGEKIEKLVFDFDSLNARDLIKAEREAKLRLSKKDRLNMVKELDNRYTSCVAAKAAGVKTELLMELGAKDFSYINMITMNFLLDGDSSEETEN